MWGSLNDYNTVMGLPEPEEIEYCAGCSKELKGGICVNEECPECPDYIEEINND